MPLDSTPDTDRTADASAHLGPSKLRPAASCSGGSHDAVLYRCLELADFIEKALAGNLPEDWEPGQAYTFVRVA